ncbi:MAG: hypothetical protein CMF69_00495 [Magnetovibrio sp.]|nr:hypothetical protein [Magnetovibrio sp.]
MESPLINQIKNNYISDRVSEIDRDFLDFEEDMISKQDQERILSLIFLLNTQSEIKFPNPHNSILLYVCGLTDEFDFKKGRSNTVGGSPPDIDIDHDALDREGAIAWVTDKWGRDNVANIITHGTFKPKSLARSFYRVTEGDTQDLNNILKKIPPPKYGREATLEEIIEKNPAILDEEKYKEFYSFANTLEDMVANFGIHAAGVVISDKPIREVVPTWKNSKADLITQFDMKEVESLGLIKFDFLSIDTLSIIKECTKLLKLNQDIEVQPYSIADGNKRAYTMLHEGLLTGVFQMETSGMAKKLITRIKPTSIEELSDISALNRPGPLQAGLDKEYMNNRKSGYAPDNLPEGIAELLKTSYWTLIYQEQVMAICSEIAGFTSKESDDIRRAMGKKDVDVLNTYKKQFINGCTQRGGLTQSYSEELWDDLIGFADYCFVPETKILRPDENKNEAYPCQLIDLINDIDSEVVSVTEENKIINQKVQQRWHRGIQEVYTYTLESGESFTCTPDHKFKVVSGEFISIDTIFEKGLELYSIYEEKKADEKTGRNS